MKIQKEFKLLQCEVEDIIKNYIQEYYEVEGSDFHFDWNEAHGVIVSTTEDEDIKF